MESRWAQLGFLGAILLAIYGFVYFNVYHLPEAFFGVVGASVLAAFLGWLGAVGGVLSAFGFLAYYSELENRYALLALILGAVAWGQQLIAHLLLSAGAFDLGAAQYRAATVWLMLCFAVWGLTLFTVRRKVGEKQRYAFCAGLLFLINALAWIGYLGIGVLVVASLLHACVLVPSAKTVKVLGLPSPARFFTPKRQYQIGQLGLALLTLYSVLATRWLVNGLFPLPLAVVTPLNSVALVGLWLAVLGLGIAFSRFETYYGNASFAYANVVSLGSLLLLSLADFTWLMSNISVFTEAFWGVYLYRFAPSFLLLSSLPLCLSSLLSGLAFLQVFLRTRKESDIEVVPLTVAFFASTLAWPFGLGYLPLIAAAPLLLRVFMRHERKTWENDGSQPLRKKPSVSTSVRRGRRGSRTSVSIIGTSQK